MQKKIYREVESLWDKSLLPALKEFIHIPALSPDFDARWEENGNLMKAVLQAKDWAEKQGVKGLKCEIVVHRGHTPCLLVEIGEQGCPETTKSVFFYGHLDKQPENEGWDKNKSPWNPVVEDGKLFGRGAVDDGYSFYTCIGAIKALQNLAIAHPRCVGLFECCEESSSRHYEEYLKETEDKLGPIGLVIALDSASGDFERLWITHSLRGMIGGIIDAQALKAGVHSGEASGIVPSSFMILRSLLDRIERSSTGEIIPEVFHCEIPASALEETKAVADLLGDEVWSLFPWYGESSPLHTDPFSCLLHRNWRPALSVTGADGIPSIEAAGNVMRVHTALKVGMRLPPLVDAEKASQAFGQIVCEDPPFNVGLSYKPTVASTGWQAPQEAAWLKRAFEESSLAYWGNLPCYLGMGASIPLLNLFNRIWPEAQFMVAGALGPNSNAHGPNESLHLGYAVRLTAAIAWIISQYED